MLDRFGDDEWDAPAASGCAIDYTPADGRLAAAISTISASRRRIRDEVDRSSELTRSISISLRATRLLLITGNWRRRVPLSRALRK
jgi:hypothetical protein